MSFLMSFSLMDVVQMRILFRVRLDAKPVPEVKTSGGHVMATPPPEQLSKVQKVDTSRII